MLHIGIIILLLIYLSVTEIRRRFEKPKPKLFGPRFLLTIHCPTPCFLWNISCKLCLSIFYWRHLARRVHGCVYVNVCESSGVRAFEIGEIEYDLKTRTVEQ